MSEQTKLKDPQQINFIGKLEDQNNEATMYFVIEKSEKTTFEFLQNSGNVKDSNLLNVSGNEYSKFA